MDGVTGGEGFGVTENPPPPTHKGEPLEKICSPPPTHIGTQGGVPTAKSSAHPGSLGGGGWEDSATGHGPSPGTQKFIYPHPRGGTLAKFSRGPGDAYLPGGEPLEKLSPHPPAAKGDTARPGPSKRPPRPPVRTGTPPLPSHTPHSRGGNLVHASFRVPRAFPIRGGGAGKTHLRTR